MKTLLKRIIKFTAICSIITIIGYFAFCFTNYEKKISKEKFIDSYFVDENRKYVFYFGNFEDSYFYRIDEELLNVEFVSYEKGIFEFYNNETNKKFLFVTIDENVIYCESLNKYMYNADLFES